jgi:CheY-like chemotaxis protein
MHENFPILIAEDNEADAAILQRAFREVGFNNPFHISTDGEDILKYLRGHPPYENRERNLFPRVLILDLNMPRMDGFEVLTWLKEHTECNVIPRIVLSTSRDEKDIQRAYQLGVNSYIYKPPTFEGLVKRLELVLSYWDMCEKPALPPQC